MKQFTQKVDGIWNLQELGLYKGQKVTLVRKPGCYSTGILDKLSFHAIGMKDGIDYQGDRFLTSTTWMKAIREIYIHDHTQEEFYPYPYEIAT